MAEPNETAKPETSNPPPTTSREAVAAAMANLNEDGTIVSNKPIPVEVSQRDTKTTKVEEAPAEEKESPEDLANALQLYKALKNPETSGSVIEYLAKQGGFVKQAQQAETKAEVKEVAEDLQDYLKESLGVEFEFLADKIAPALKKFLGKEFERQQADIRESLLTQEREKVEAQSTRILTKLSTDFFGTEVLPDNVSKEMSRLMDKIPAQQDMSTKEYLELIFDTAKGRLGLVKASAKPDTSKARAESNRSDAASRLASDRGGSKVGTPVKDTSKPMDRRQAIQAALDEVNESVN